MHEIVSQLSFPAFGYLSSGTLPRFEVSDALPDAPTVPAAMLEENAALLEECAEARVLLGLMVRGSLASIASTDSESLLNF